LGPASSNGTVHTCVGQELFPIVLARYLRADDYVVSNHRGHGHYLSVTGDFEGLIAEVMGRTSGASGGYGGSYAQSSSKRQTLAGTIAGRSGAFGIKYFEADIADVFGLDETCRVATRYIRDELLPAVVHIHTMRLNSHSKGDDNRDRDEIQALHKRARSENARMPSGERKWSWIYQYC